MKQILHISLCIKALALCALVLGTCCLQGCHSSKNSGKTVRRPQRPDIEAADKGQAQKLISEARSWLGVPYKYGGTGRDGADCSGFLQQVYLNALGVSLPRTTAAQREHCSPVDSTYLSPGDIIFFTSRRSDGKVAHVGMYTGNGKMIHASSSRGVVEDNLRLKYYQTHYAGAGRPPELAMSSTTKTVETRPQPRADSIRLIVVDSISLGKLTAKNTAEKSPSVTSKKKPVRLHADKPDTGKRQDEIEVVVTETDTFIIIFEGKVINAPVKEKEEVSLKQQTPIKEESQTKQQTPIKEETPVKEETPAKEQSPVKEYSPAVEVKNAFGKANNTQR